MKLARTARFARDFRSLPLQIQRRAAKQLQLLLDNPRHPSLRIHLICDNMMFKGDFTPIFHKHTSRLDLTDLLSSWRNNPVILFVKGWNTIA